MDYGINVETINLENIEPSGTNSPLYSGDLIVSFKNVGLLRSIGTIKIPLKITLAGTSGAQPISDCQSIPDYDDDDDDMEEYGGCRGPQVGAYHSNGGGFVSDTATVVTTAFVGKNASVCDQAQVLGNARIEGSAIISDTSLVGNTAIVADMAKVERNSRVSGTAKVYGRAIVSHESIIQSAKIYGNAKVIHSTVSGTEAYVYGNAKISNSVISAASNVTIKDHAIVSGGSEVCGGSIGCGLAPWTYTGPPAGVTIEDHGKVTGGSKVYNGVRVFSHGEITGGALVDGNPEVSGIMDGRL